jgi:hypothetical protein
MRIAGRAVATNRIVPQIIDKGPFGKDLNECHCDRIEIISWQRHGVAEESHENIN